jgi:hypothetical protein
MQSPFSHQNGHPPRHGPLAYDPYIGFIAIGVDNVLTFAGAAATRYIAGNIPGGEDLHVEAEATYTRLMKNLARFNPRTGAIADYSSKNLSCSASISALTI